MPESDLRRFLRRHFTAIDLLKIILSLASGYGIALLVEDTRVGVGVLALCVLAASGAFAIDRLRLATEDEVSSALRETKEQVHTDLSTLNREVSTHLARLRNELDRHIDLVHAGVRFIPDSQGDEEDGTGYDVATAAVRKARRRIYVVSDYSPPEGEGATLLDPPDNRSEYLDAIEDCLTQRLSANGRAGAPLSYHRLIQRPPEIYAEMVQRSVNGVELRREDMEGDLQAFEHLARVMDIARHAGANRRIDIQMRVIPFLPNCPSILLVDDEELQFTIPTRIDQPGDRFALLGLHGVMVMEDRASGTQLCDHFSSLFGRLKTKSLPIVKVRV
ncbi:hypothetical protein ACFY1U_21455 [Streptomyces sp. NPDC001351]|uniref:hypothetical protein n=1 Tax=Streptomyces sp. NPDC001351 TaxID=3364564 RepID=UPI0036CF5FAE